MKLKDQIYLVIIAVLLIIILFLRSCTPIIKPEPTGKVSYSVRVDTITVYKHIRDSIPYPVPVKSKTIIPATFKDTCPPIVENIYEFPFNDSLINGKTSITTLGTVTSFVRDYTVKQKEITKTAILKVETEKKPRNQYLIGMDLGGNFKTSTPALGVNFTFVGTKGVAVSLRRDLIQGQTTIGAHINLRKP